MKYFILSSADDSQGIGSIFIIPEGDMVDIVQHPDEDDNSEVANFFIDGEPISLDILDYEVIEATDLVHK